MKNKVVSVLGKALAGLGGFVLANVAGCVIVGRMNMDKIKNHENANNLMHSTLFGKKEITLNPDTDNAYISIFTSCVDITIPKPEHENMNIELFSVFSKVNITLPEDAPEVHIVQKGFGSKVIYK